MADVLIQGTTIIEDKRSERGEVWSCSASQFIALRPDAEGVEYDDNRNQVSIDGTNAGLNASVQLPNGAIITGVVVHGNDTGETWTLYRDLITLGASADTLATAAIGTESTTISNATVNNHDYVYWINISVLDSADAIYGARIKYTF